MYQIIPTMSTPWHGGWRIALGDWRTALIVFFALRLALCALRIAPPAKTFDKGGHRLQPEKIFKQTMTTFGNEIYLVLFLCKEDEVKYR
jgi:hypothetical protein